MERLITQHEINRRTGINMTDISAALSSVRAVNGGRPQQYRVEDVKKAMTTYYNFKRDIARKRAIAADKMWRDKIAAVQKLGG